MNLVFTKKNNRMANFLILLIAYISHYFYYYSVFNHTYSNVAFLVCIALISITIGYIFGNNFKLDYNKDRHFIIHRKNLSYKGQKIIAFIFIAVGILSHIFFYRTHHIGSYAEGYEVARGNGYITVFFNFWIVGMIIIEYLTQNGLIDKKTKIINRILMIIYVFLYFIVLTKRRQIIILFLACMGIWKDRFSKRQKILIYILGVIAVFAFMIFGKVRGYVDANGFSQGISYTINNFSTEWISLEQFEGKYISRTLNDVYGYVQINGHDPSVLLGVLFCMIPRKLLGGLKPPAFPEWYTIHFHFSDYLRGTGYAGSMVGELYLIGDVYLVIFGYLIIGYISARIQKFREHKSNIRDTLVYSLFLYTIFILPRYDLSSLLMDAVFMYFPIIWFCGGSGLKDGLENSKALVMERET